MTIELPELQRRVRVAVSNYGTQRVNGRKAYKIGNGTCIVDILQRRGWSLAKKTKKYVYMVPPEGVTAEEALVVELLVPTKEQTLDVAQRLHKAHHNWDWEDRWGELEARYYFCGRYHPQSIDPFTGERGPRRIRGSNQSNFTVGDHGLFTAHVDDINGQNRYHESADFRPEREPTLFDESRRLVDQPNIEQIGFVEGGVQESQYTRYERDPRARQACIARWGCTCVVCGFNFEKFYGEVGTAYIQIHHLEPLAATGRQQVTDPVHDLRPVCANCHAMIHRRKPILSPEQLRAILNMRSKVLK
jgi:hypothetical protein